MTKAQIKAELRRSAMEDVSPFTAIHMLAFWEAFDNTQYGENMGSLSVSDLRNFLLLSAEAIDD